MTTLSLEAQKQLAELATQLAHNPATRKEFTRLVRQIDPTKRFPDVEADDLREDIRKEFAQRDQRALAEATERRLSAQRHELIASGRFTPEEVGDMEKNVMEKYGVSDYEAAAKIASADRKPASPTPDIRGATWKIPTISAEDMKDLNGYARQKANNVISEIMQKRA